MDIVKLAGLVAAIALPLWNIPLIVHMFRRRSSKDISIYWAVGVWVCLVVMFPSGLASSDIVWKTFNIINLVLFSAVASCVIIFRFKNK